MVARKKDMKKVLLISPHFDDAVLSAGQFMADRPDAEVCTVFAGYPLTPDRKKTPYDEKCGFKNAEDAVTQRRIENEQAIALLEATSINLNFPDSQYGEQPSETNMQAALQEIIDKGNYEFILAPLGLGHPDHIKVTDILMRLHTDLPIWLWEDMPLRVVEPELVPQRLIAVMGHNVSIDKLWQPSTTGDKIAKKIRAMLCYKSQINTGILDPYVMYVPERFWKL